MRTESDSWGECVGFYAMKHHRNGRYGHIASQMEVCLEEVEEEGLLVSWHFSRRPLLSLTVSPRKIQREVRAETGAAKASVASDSGGHGTVGLLSVCFWLSVAP